MSTGCRKSVTRLSCPSILFLCLLDIPNATIPQSCDLSPASLAGCVPHCGSSFSLSPPSTVPSWGVLGFQPFPEHYIWFYCFQLLFSHHLSSLARGHSLPERVAETLGCLRLQRPPGTTLSPQETAVLLPHLLWGPTALLQRLKLYLGPEFISHPWASCFRGKAVSESVLWPEFCYCGKALILKTARKITTESFPMMWIGKKGMTEGRST